MVSWLVLFEWTPVLPLPEARPNPAPVDDTAPGLRAGTGALVGSVVAGAATMGVHRARTGGWPTEVDVIDEASTQRMAAAVTLVGLVLVPAGAAALAPQGRRVGAAVGAALGFGVPQVGMLLAARHHGSYGAVRPKTAAGKLAVDVGIPVLCAAIGATVPPRKVA